MKFGLNLLNFGPGASAESIAASADWTERTGFHLVMVSDHVAVTPDVAQAYPAPFTNRSRRWRGLPRGPLWRVGCVASRSRDADTATT